MIPANRADGALSERQLGILAAGALASTAVAFYCLVSLYFYRGNAALDAEDILRVGVPAALGGLAGAALLRRIPQQVMQQLFAVVVMLGGVLMLLK